MSGVIRGSCHCKAVAWQARLPPKIVINCHCSLCRQLSGADYSAWVVIPNEQFRINKGSDSVSHYSASEHFSKVFCKVCGSTVSCVNNAKFPDHTYVARGNILGDVALPVDLQVYTNDRAQGIHLDADIPVYNP